MLYRLICIAQTIIFLKIYFFYRELCKQTLDEDIDIKIITILDREFSKENVVKQSFIQKLNVQLAIICFSKCNKIKNDLPFQYQKPLCNLLLNKCSDLFLKME